MIPYFTGGFIQFGKEREFHQYTYKGEGDLDFEGDYRPISVIGHIARLVESLVCSQIIHYLESHDFVSHDQSAYLKPHST